MSLNLGHDEPLKNTCPVCRTDFSKDNHPYKYQCNGLCCAKCKDKHACTGNCGFHGTPVLPCSNNTSTCSECGKKVDLPDDDDEEEEANIRDPCGRICCEDCRRRIPNCPKQHEVPNPVKCLCGNELPGEQFRNGCICENCRQDAVKYTDYIKAHDELVKQGVLKGSLWGASQTSEIRCSMCRKPITGIAYKVKNTPLVFCDEDFQNMKLGMKPEDYETIDCANYIEIEQIKCYMCKSRDVDFVPKVECFRDKFDEHFGICTNCIANHADKDSYTPANSQTNIEALIAEISKTVKMVEAANRTILEDLALHYNDQELFQNSEAMNIFEIEEMQNECNDIIAKTADRLKDEVNSLSCRCADAVNLGVKTCGKCTRDAIKNAQLLVAVQNNPFHHQAPLEKGGNIVEKAQKVSFCANIEDLKENARKCSIICECSNVKNETPGLTRVSEEPLIFTDKGISVGVEVPDSEGVEVEVGINDGGNLAFHKVDVHDSTFSIDKIHNGKEVSIIRVRRVYPTADIFCTKKGGCWYRYFVEHDA